MKGSKKVNHFLRDGKLPTSIKKQTWVLCSNKAVVWVVNHRINEKFKITEKTNKCLRISCTEA
jgi:tRNA(Ile)-lysidine synthase